MKLIYSHLQKFLPDLNVEPKKLRDDLTMIGHFTNFYEEIDNEIVFDLDIKINRGDCLGYYGLARDLSVLYNIKLNIPNTNYVLPITDYVLPITVTSPDVTRIMAIKISNVKVSQSPEWLVKFTHLHNINSVNNIVDLTNYVMFMYGIPNHAFDANICSDNLIWENNQGKTTKFTTLDGTILDLSSDNLVISNPQEVLSTDLVGGKNSGINNGSTDIIIEVAIYNRVRIRLDSKELKTVTEASIRLEKDLDPDTIPLAFNYLTSLIIEQSESEVSSSVFDYYPNPQATPTIKFDPKLPSIISGINIPEDFALDIVAKVGSRKDITIEEDLVEEVIRFYGYNKIPINEPLSFKEVSNITPPIINLIEQRKDDLITSGYDEVITWPLVDTPTDPKTVITTQNSINSESIYLRQSLIPSLQKQLDLYNRFKVPNPKFFEIGKVFSKSNDQYVEKYALGTYDGQNFEEIILDNLEMPDSYTPKVIDNTAIELTSQIITLDANITINDRSDPLDLIKKYSSLIDKNILWSMEIIDIFENKYTFRVCYYNTDDKTAKKIHLDTFNLN